MTSRRILKSVFVALLLVTAAAVVVSTLEPLAFAAPTIDIFPSTANPGTTVSIIGSSFNIADAACVVLGPASLFTSSTCAILNGNVQGSFTVLNGAPPVSVVTVSAGAGPCPPNTNCNVDSASAVFAVPIQVVTTSTTTSTTTTSVTSSTSTLATTTSTSSTISTTTVSSIGISTATYVFYMTQSILDQTTTTITNAPIFTILTNTTQTVATTTVTTITNTTTTVTGFIVALLADNLNALGLIALAVVLVPSLLRRFFV